MIRSVLSSLTASPGAALGFLFFLVANLPIVAHATEASRLTFYKAGKTVTFSGTRHYKDKHKCHIKFKVVGICD